MYFQFQFTMFFSYRTENEKKDKFVLTVQSHQIVLELSLIHFWIRPETFESIRLNISTNIETAEIFIFVFRPLFSLRDNFFVGMLKSCLGFGASVFCLQKPNSRHQMVRRHGANSHWDIFKSSICSENTNQNFQILQLNALFLTLLSMTIPMATRALCGPLPFYAAFLAIEAFKVIKISNQHHRHENLSFPTLD